jgi:hypothetical protein
MSRPRGSATVICHTRLRPIENAILEYMGGSNGRSNVLRQMVWYFVEHSENFDPAGFEEYVRAALLPGVGPEEGKALLAEVARIVEDRKKSVTIATKKSFISAEGVGAWLKKRQASEEG